MPARQLAGLPSLCLLAPLAYDHCLGLFVLFSLALACPIGALAAFVPSQSCPPARLPDPHPFRKPGTMNEATSSDVIIGVDTHKQTHTAVAITGLGVRVGEVTVSACTQCYLRGTLSW